MHGPYTYLKAEYCKTSFAPMYIYLLGEGESEKEDNFVKIYESLFDNQFSYDGHKTGLNSEPTCG